MQNMINLGKKFGEITILEAFHLINLNNNNILLPNTLLSSIILNNNLCHYHIQSDKNIHTSNTYKITLIIYKPTIWIYHQIKCLLGLPKYWPIQCPIQAIRLFSPLKIMDSRPFQHMLCN